MRSSETTPFSITPPALLATSEMDAPQRAYGSG